MLDSLLLGEDEAQVLATVIDGTPLESELLRPLTLGAVSIELCRTTTLELCQMSSTETWPIAVAFEGVEFKENIGFTGYFKANSLSADAIYLNGNYAVTIDGLKDSEGTVTKRSLFENHSGMNSTLVAKASTMSSGTLRN